MNSPSFPPAETTSAVRRRTVVGAAAWTVPVIAAAVGAPLAAASGDGPVRGEFDDCYYGWPDTTVSHRTAKRADGVRFTLKTASGSPVPDGTLVSFSLGDFDDNSLWFVSDPNTRVGEDGEVVAAQLQFITLPSVGGVVSLDGYLRRGSDANHADEDQTITASWSIDGQFRSTRVYWAIGSASSWFGDDDDADYGPKDQAQNERAKGDDWF